MRLINEITEEYYTSEQLDEATGQKTIFIEGVFAQADMKNRNGRIYPKKVLGNAINEYVEKYVKTNRALGELNHPTTPQVDPERACIKIDSLSWEGNNVIGKARVLSTPKGQILAGLIRDGVQLGVSTRGLGSVKATRINNESVNVVGEDYSIRAIDVVHNPSGIDCFVNGILENVEFYYNQAGILSERKLEILENQLKNDDLDAIFTDFSKILHKLSF